MKLDYTRPGKPKDNGLIESFNGRFLVWSSFGLCVASANISINIGDRPLAGLAISRAGLRNAIRVRRVGTWRAVVAWRLLVERLARGLGCGPSRCRVVGDVFSLYFFDYALQKENLPKRARTFTSRIRPGCYWPTW